MSHELLPPIYDHDLPGGDDILEKYECSCGHWRRIFRLSNALSQQEVESEHEDHIHEAGATELRLGVLPMSKTVPNEALEPLLRAMAKFAEATMKTAEAMREFNEAQAAAEEKGIGVVIVRHPDGSVTSTPNVFIPAGTAVFMDMPGLPTYTPTFDWTPEECTTHPTSSPEPSSPSKAA